MTDGHTLLTKVTIDLVGRSSWEMTMKSTAKHEDATELTVEFARTARREEAALTPPRARSGRGRGRGRSRFSSRLSERGSGLKRRSCERSRPESPVHDRRLAATMLEVRNILVAEHPAIRQRPRSRLDVPNRIRRLSCSPVTRSTSVPLATRSSSQTAGRPTRRVRGALAIRGSLFVQ